MMAAKRSLFFLIIPLLSFAPSGNEIRTEYYYSLNFLKTAGPPEELNMVIISNMSTGRSILSRGVLFTFKDRGAREVRIAGNFSRWNTAPMKRSKNGVWYYFFQRENREGPLKYKFIVDGIWTVDYENPLREDDMAGSYLSVFNPSHLSVGPMITLRQPGDGSIEFRLYNPRAKFISVIGDFNNWNPEHDILKKSEKGTWHLMKRIPPGTYRYSYFIDGHWTPDIYNSNSASDDSGEICSLLIIPQP